MNNDQNKGLVTGAQEEAPLFLAGLPDRFRLLSLLAKGGMGCVFAATDLTMNRDVAIKLLQYEGSNTEQAQERFLRETKVLASLKHPNIVQILSSGLTASGEPYYVMELIEGESLGSELQRTKTLSIKRFFEIFSEVLDGLSYIHEHGIIHRDLKPDNIMILKDNENGSKVKIIDFGIARNQGNESSHGSLTKTNAVLGSPAYMSPEQCKGDRLDHACDIYSLSCIMYQCLSGNQPFNGATAIEIMYKHMNENPPVLKFAGASKNTKEFALLIQQCMQKDPRQRPQSAAVIRKHLEEILQSDFKISSQGEFKKTKNKQLLILGLSLILLFAAGTCVAKILREKTAASGQLAPPNTTIHKQKRRIGKQSITEQLTEVRETYEKAKPYMLQEQITLLNTILDDPKAIKRDRFAALELKACIQARNNESVASRLVTEKQALAFSIINGKDSTETLYCLMNIAELENQRKNYSEANRHALRALSLVAAQNQGNLLPSLGLADGTSCQSGIPASHLSHLLGMISYNRGDVETAKTQLNNAINLSWESRNWQAAALAARDLSSIHLKEREKKDALKLLSQMDSDLLGQWPGISSNDAEELVRTLDMIANIALENKLADTGIKAAKDGIILAERSSPYRFPEESRKLHETLAKLESLKSSENNK